jgi:hypothetical protein
MALSKGVMCVRLVQIVAQPRVVPLTLLQRLE